MREPYPAPDPELIGRSWRLRNSWVAEGMTMLVVTHEMKSPERGHKGGFYGQWGSGEEGAPEFLRLPRQERPDSFWPVRWAG